MKQGQCICPLSWSVHWNFTGECKCIERGWACTSHPYQPALILPSWLNVCQKAAVATLCTLWYTATSAAHRTHDIQEGIYVVKEDPKSFLLSSYLCPAPLADTATMAPLSFPLTHRAGTCLPLLASKGNRGGANHMKAKQMWFSSLLLFHAFMQPHSFSISNLVLAVPSTYIHEWITDLYTSKHFT